LLSITIWSKPMLSEDITEVKNDDKVLSFAEHCHKKLVSLIGDNVEQHRDDLLIHDLNAISRLTKREFIHVSCCCATFLYGIPQPIEDNSRVDYLFGRKRPSSIYRETLEMLSDFFGRPSYFGYEHTYCYCDGKSVRVVSKDEAVALYRNSLTSVLRDLRYRNMKTELMA